MPYKTPEERKAYSKQYYEANKERILADKKQQYESDTEKFLARHKQWREDNSEEWHRSYTITVWKRIGVIHDDYDALYDQYMATTNCADCGKEFQGKKGDGLGAYRCLDHDHITHAFRAVVCNACNIQRGFVDRKLKLEAQSP